MTNLNHSAKHFISGLLLTLLLASHIVKAQKTDQPTGSTAQVVSEGGVRVEFTIEPLVEAPKARPLMEGDEARLRFKVLEATGQAVPSARPAAWVDVRRSGVTTDKKLCHDKVQSFLQGSLGGRPTVDLNTYYVVVLNQEPNISVIDPLLGFGNSKLYTLVLLKSPGEDWVLSRDKKKLYVTMPGANQVAVVDTTSWKVSANIDAGEKPARIALNNDEKYLWVGNDGEGTNSGVTAIDLAQGKAVAHIETGAGHHELALTTDDRYVFVANESGSVSVVDVQSLAKVKDINTGAKPASIAYSPKSRTAYVAAHDTVLALSADTHEIVARMTDEPGLQAVRISPDGRWGFVVNSKLDYARVFDTSSNAFVQKTAVGKPPDQISFSDAYAYVRSRASEQVALIALSDIGKGNTLATIKIPGGQLAPELAGGTPSADAIVQSTESGSVLIANPADKIIYFYTEGMAAPMGNFQNYRRTPRSILVVDRNLREISPGEYSTTLRLPHAGTFDVAFLLDSPRLLHCFDLAVHPNPDLKKERQMAVHLEPLTRKEVRVGESLRLRFRVIDAGTEAPIDGLNDMQVLAMLAPGLWQKRLPASPIGHGQYEATLLVAKPGAYFVFFESAGAGLKYSQIAPFTFRAVQGSAEAQQSSRPDALVAPLEASND